MEFGPFEQAEDAVREIESFVASADGKKLPKDIKEKINEIMKPDSELTGTSISFRAAYFVELVYARQEEVKAPALALAAAVAEVCELHGIDNIRGERGRNLVKVLKGTKIAKASQPERRAQFSKDPPETAVPDAPAPEPTEAE